MTTASKLYCLIWCTCFIGLCGVLPASQVLGYRLPLLYCVAHPSCLLHVLKHTYGHLVPLSTRSFLVCSTLLTDNRLEDLLGPVACQS